MAFFSTPDYQQVDITDEAKGILKKQVSQAELTPDQLAEQTVSGIDKSKEIMNQQSNQPQTLGMTFPEDTQKALQARAQRAYESSNIGLKNQARLKSSDRAAQIGAGAAHNALQYQGIQNKWYQNELTQRDNRMASRYQMIGALFGAGGSVGGAALGSMRNPSPTPASSYGGSGVENMGQGPTAPVQLGATGQSSYQAVGQPTMPGQSPFQNWGNPSASNPGYISGMPINQGIY